MECSCPLCGDVNLTLVDKLDVSIIKKHYLSTGLNVDYLFSNAKYLDCLKCDTCKLQFFSPIILGDSKYYSHLQREDWYFLHEDKTEYEFSKKYVKSEMNVLDVGSGRGVFSRYIDCGYYQGLDLSKKALELAKKDGINVIDETIQEHAKKKTNFYDVVVLFQVLEHVSEIDSFVNNSLHCLKKGGKFIVAVPNNESFIKYSVNNFLNMPPHHQLLWNEKSLASLGEKYNLKLKETFKEKVTNVHREYFYDVLYRRLLLKYKGWAFHQVSNQWEAPVSSLAKSFIKMYVSFRKMLNWHKTQDGQTIIFVYEK